MPNWTYNKVTVRGEPRHVAEFAAQVAGSTSSGEPTPLSLNAIDPMPPECENNASWGDSAEYAALRGQLDGLADDEKAAFLRANRGFSAEGVARHTGMKAPASWISWRIQHWGTQSELDDRTMVERSDDGTEIVFDFDTPHSDVAPAIATAASRFPDLEFTLVSQDEFVEEETVTIWRDGREVSVTQRPSSRNTP